MPTPPDDQVPPSSRHFIQWGRAPQTVFRAGPLPGAKPSARPPVDPVVARPPASILNGSMIPRRQPATDMVLPPVAARVEPRVDPAPTAVPSVAPVEADPVPPPMATAPHPPSGRKRPYLVPAAVAVAAVTVAGGAWLLARPDPVPETLRAESPEAVTVPALPTAAPDRPTVADVRAVPVAPVPAPVTPVERARPAPDVRARRPAVAEAEPLTPAEAGPAPVSAPVSPPVVLVEPVMPPPTPARPPSTDPNAPIVTRPQPLDSEAGPVSE